MAETIEGYRFTVDLDDRGCGLSYLIWQRKPGR